MHLWYYWKFKDWLGNVGHKFQVQQRLKCCGKIYFKPLSVKSMLSKVMVQLPFRFCFIPDMNSQD